jgi:sulfonate transport system permease protein
MSPTVHADPAAYAEKPESKKSKTSNKNSNSSKYIRLFIRGALLPVIVVVAWQLLSASEIISSRLFPTPLFILQTFIEMLQSGELLHHLRISVVRASLGFVIGGGSGLLIGLLVGMSTKAEHYLNPTVQMLRTIPLLAITPLFILWFGFGELSKVLLISMGSFFPLYVNTFLGVRNVKFPSLSCLRHCRMCCSASGCRSVSPGSASSLPN